jgi:hypothetical protein
MRERAVLWAGERRSLAAQQKRGSFSPRACQLTDLDVMLGKVAAAAPDTLVEVSGAPTRWDAVPQHYPHIARRLTPAWKRN